MRSFSLSVVPRSGHAQWRVPRLAALVGGVARPRWSVRGSDGCRRPTGGDQDGMAVPTIERNVRREI